MELGMGSHVLICNIVLPLGTYLTNCSGTYPGYGECTCFTSCSIDVCWTINRMWYA